MSRQPFQVRFRRCLAIYRLQITGKLGAIRCDQRIRSRAVILAGILRLILAFAVVVPVHVSRNAEHLGRNRDRIRERHLEAFVRYVRAVSGL